MKQPSGESIHLPMADDAETGLVAFFDPRVPKVDSSSYEAVYRGYYKDHAQKFLVALRRHAPQGFTDALLAVLCEYKASILRVR